MSKVDWDSCKHDVPIKMSLTDMLTMAMELPEQDVAVFVMEIIARSSYKVAESIKNLLEE